MDLNWKLNLKEKSNFNGFKLKKIQLYLNFYRIINITNLWGQKNFNKQLSQEFDKIIDFINYLPYLII